MADAHAKPKAAAPEASGGSSDVVMFFAKFFAGLILVVLGFLFVVSNSARAIALNQFLFMVQIFALLVIAISIFLIGHYVRKYKRVNESITGLYEKKYTPKVKSEATQMSHEEKRLGIIQEHIFSDKPAEWRLGIIEMDAMMFDVLRDRGYAGETIAEQLHAAEVKRFGSYENAWEAHKVRNRIAHEGVKFELTQNEAKRVYKLYATVFEEFGIVI
jgi:hypothetical protein